MIFEIRTEETVSGIYDVEADSPSEAVKKFEDGEVTKPRVYEAISVEKIEVYFAESTLPLIFTRHY